MILALKRLFAYWIDFTMLAVILVSLQWLINAAASGFPFDDFDKGIEIELWVLATMSLPVWSFFTVMELRDGQTFGKKWLNLRVTNRRGEPIRLWQALARTAVRLLPWEMTHAIILVPEPWWSVETPAHPGWIYLPNGLMIVYLVILFSTKGSRTCHDLVAGTKVNPSAREREITDEVF
ncbi:MULTISPECIES: RDD family protein [Paenibacillus]|uniref:RDD family protein n=2 Tax=Paenibacillus TaxID=44249 RepID=UPI0001AFCB85|nr:MULTISPECIES: RDD family protein [unclassified Paenibacillus]EES74940.1 RDD family protein [Paenibacillus sp. oral taxon 786 str. D14]MCT2196465.1 RDD family protein [Paenibacillus sp. p3-SID1389]